MLPLSALNVEYMLNVVDLDSLKMFFKICTEGPLYMDVNY